MEQQQLTRICELLDDIIRRLERIEMQVEDYRYHTIEFINRRPELKIEDYERASSEGVNEID